VSFRWTCCPEHSAEQAFPDVAKCAKKAHKEGLTLKEAVVQLKMLTPDEFDQEVRPELMLYPD
jgi:fumarate hydratase class II